MVGLLGRVISQSQGIFLHHFFKLQARFNYLQFQDCFMAALEENGRTER
jgi:hypothetical protein